jgi:hypothetical protein
MATRPMVYDPTSPGNPCIAPLPGMTTTPAGKEVTLKKLCDEPLTPSTSRLGEYKNDPM